MQQAPFSYFGGKSEVAAVIWQALGADVTNYVEPFAGSLAVLLQRPGGAGKTETVNDADGLLANVWRAMRHDPEQVAEHANWPVNECDLHARHLWLIGQRDNLTDRLMADPDWYCAKAAGWWIWGACAWIGSGWCSGNGPWRNVDGVLTDIRKMPHVGDAGRGINRQMPHVGDAGRDAWIQDYFSKLAKRLRHTRVLCGDFERVLGPSVTMRHGVTGIFLDPPYDAGNHDPYSVNDGNVARRALQWAASNGFDENLRIVLAGYDGEHNRLEDDGWTRYEWKTAGGYGSQGDGRGRQNAHREVLWLSPHCLAIHGNNYELF